MWSIHPPAQYFEQMPMMPAARIGGFIDPMYQAVYDSRMGGGYDYAHMGNAAEVVPMPPQFYQNVATNVAGARVTARSSLKRRKSAARHALSKAKKRASSSPGGKGRVIKRPAGQKILKRYGLSKLGGSENFDDSNLSLFGGADLNMLMGHNENNTLAAGAKKRKSRKRRAGAESLIVPSSPLDAGKKRKYRKRRSATRRAGSEADISTALTAGKRRKRRAGSEADVSTALTAGKRRKRRAGSEADVSTALTAGKRRKRRAGSEAVESTSLVAGAKRKRRTRRAGSEAVESTSLAAGKRKSKRRVVHKRRSTRRAGGSEADM
jgi:hypothetical protein